MSLMKQRFLRRGIHFKIEELFHRSNRYFKNCARPHSNQYMDCVKRKISSPYYDTSISQEENRSFFNTFPVITKDLTDHEVFCVFPDMKKRLIRMMEYASLAGNKNVSLTTLMAYKSFEKPENLKEKNMKMAYILGWLAELVQVAICMTTDVAEEVRKRNDIPTWYTHADVCLRAANDSTILENYIFLLLKKYFSSHPCYKQMIDLFNDAIYKTFQGIYFESCNVNIKDFSFERVEKIAKYKFGFSCYLLPFRIARYLADSQDLGGFESTENVLLDMAKYTKIQSDYLDSFGNQSSNKNIRLGRCSWLALRAFEQADPHQKELLEKFYGRMDLESADKIRYLYDELDLSADFQAYCRESINSMKRNIEGLPRHSDRVLLNQVLNNVVSTKALSNY